ncbi:flavin reductase family protein [uncultured Modestobacter sp.]|uniref:flavin reductase family protein n=1 Tax=uncultured Modestobacter sp. TaxID=380048 RepID=UPI002638D04F|nr:flavin reductase family protein [uncultured Modestobacter sp.]
MGPDLDAAAATLNGLRPFPVAITTVSGGRTNGLISLSAGGGSILPEAPRVTISITKYNFSHDLVRESGVFALHLLGASDELLPRSLRTIMTLGGSSGRDGDKLAGLDWTPGVTGSPVLADALSYVEGRVVGVLDNEENSIFLADVVAAERLHGGRRLDIGTAWKALPAEWTETYDREHLHQTNAARRARGLPELTDH